MASEEGSKLRKVAVIGAKGRMGRTVCQAIEAAKDLQLVACLDGDDQITKTTLNGAQLAVEFTNPRVCQDNVLALLAAQVHVVVGTSGWDDNGYARVEQAAKQARRQVLVAPNFAISAVLVMAFAKLAASYFASAEVIETHHPNKLDAPSGTALATAKAMVAARQVAGLEPAPDATEDDPEHARGMKLGDVAIHSLRISGANAHQKVILGNPGEALELATDCYDRASFMPGVLLACRKIGLEGASGLIVGLDQVMDLGIG